MNKWVVQRAQGGKDQDLLKIGCLLVLVIKLVAVRKKLLRTMISLVKAHPQYKETLVPNILTQATKTEI
jgi:hypothetical protein